MHMYTWPEQGPMVVVEGWYLLSIKMTLSKY